MATGERYYIIWAGNHCAMVTVWGGRIVKARSSFGQRFKGQSLQAIKTKYHRMGAMVYEIDWPVNYE